MDALGYPCRYYLVDIELASPPHFASFEDWHGSMDRSLSPSYWLDQVYSHESTQVSLPSNDPSASPFVFTDPHNSQPVARSATRFLNLDGVYESQIAPRIVYRDMGPNLPKELSREYSQEYEGLAKIMFPSICSWTV